MAVVLILMSCKGWRRCLYIPPVADIGWWQVVFGTEFQGKAGIGRSIGLFFFPQRTVSAPLCLSLSLSLSLSLHALLSAEITAVLWFCLACTRILLSAVFVFTVVFGCFPPLWLAPRYDRGLGCQGYRFGMASIGKDDIPGTYREALL